MHNERNEIFIDISIYLLDTTPYFLLQAAFLYTCTVTREVVFLKSVSIESAGIITKKTFVVKKSNVAILADIDDGFLFLTPRFQAQMIFRDLQLLIVFCIMMIYPTELVLGLALVYINLIAICTFFNVRHIYLLFQRSRSLIVSWIIFACCRLSLTPAIIIALFFYLPLGHGLQIILLFITAIFNGK